MNIRRQKGVLLFGAASLGVAINVSTSLVSANNESKDIKKPSKALNILLNVKNSIFNKLKNAIYSVVSYLISKPDNLNNKKLYDIPDGDVADLWNRYIEIEKKLHDRLKEVKGEKYEDVLKIREIKEKFEQIYGEEFNTLHEKLSILLVPYAKLFVNLENLELRMNEKNDKILITMKDDTTNNDKSMPLDFLCEVLHKMLSNFRGIDFGDYKKIEDNCKLLRLLTKRKEQFLILTRYQRGEKLYSEISSIINSIRSNNKNVVNYLEDCCESLKIKDNYIEEVFGKNFKPEQATKLEEFKKLRSYILEKIKSEKLENAKEIVEDFNLSAKELFPNEYEDLLIKSQE